jgi:hypothetical protein
MRKSERVLSVIEEGALTSSASGGGKRVRDFEARSQAISDPSM